MSQKRQVLYWCTRFDSLSENIQRTTSNMNSETTLSSVRKASGWSMVWGVIMLICGILAIGLPFATSVGIVILLAWLKIVFYFNIRGAANAGWVLFDGIITLILGFLIWRRWPSSSVWVIGTLLGISLIFSGISRIMLSLAVRRVTSATA